jgi:hypothetical protein
MSMPSRSSRIAAAFLLYFDRKKRKLRRDRHWTGDPKSVCKKGGKGDSIKQIRKKTLKFRKHAKKLPCNVCEI